MTPSPPPAGVKRFCFCFRIFILKHYHMLGNVLICISRPNHDALIGDSPDPLPKRIRYCLLTIFFLSHFILHQI